MNTVRKGNRLQNEFRKLLEKIGFVCYTAKRTAFGGNDIWGCFDIMAKQRNLPHDYYYFQISSDFKYGSKKKELEGYPCGLYDHVYMVRKPDRKGFELRYFDNYSKEWGSPIDFTLWLADRKEYENQKKD